MTLPIRPADAVLGAVLALYLGPVWGARRLPTQDGPSHVYNAYVLAQLLAGPTPPLGEAFAVRREPVPNWAGHAVLTGLMALGAPPLTAEKVLVSAYLAGMALGCRHLLRSVAPGQETWAPLALPLAYNFPFFMGFYNFLVGVPVALFLLGYAWRCRDRLGPREATALAGMLVVLELAHLVAFGAGAVGLTVILLVGSRRRPAAVAKLVPIFLPAMMLVGWYAANSDRDYLDRSPPWRVVAESDDTPAKLLGRFSTSVLAPTPHHGARAGPAVVGVLLLAALAAGVTALRRDGDRAYAAFWETKGAFLAATAELLALALLFPQNWGRHGGCFTERLAIFVGLLSLAWLPVPRTRAGRASVLTLASGIALADLAAVAAEVRDGDRALGRLLAEMPGMPDGSRVLPLLFNTQPFDKVLLLDHLAAYLCLRPGVVDWANYEAHGFCFPVRFAAGFIPPDPGVFRGADASRAEEILARTDVALVGPACPPGLRRRIASALPHARRAGRITVYSRRPLPGPSRPS